jgi:PqqD family protein of HPr-rel-A system
MAFSDDTVFTAAVGFVPLTKRWENEVVAYNPLSAETHLLDLPTAGLLDTLSDHPASFGDLSSTFAPQYREFIAAGDAQDYLRRALEQLCAIDLIQVLENASA